MIEKGRISAIEAAMIIIPAILVTALLATPSITARLASRDMWLSPILASLGGFFTVYAACKLHRLYPGETVVQYSEHILGRVLGKISGLVFLLFYLHMNSGMTRYYGEFIVMNFLPRTPIIVIMGSIVLVSAFAVYGGLEVLMRCTLLIVPFGVLMLFSIVFFLLPELHIKHMLPMAENGAKPLLIGSAELMVWFGLFFALSFLLPYLKQQEKIVKWSMVSVFAVMVLMSMIFLTLVLLFGDVVARQNFSIIIAVRYISVADFFQHVESIVMSFWVLGAFLEISLLYYIVVLGTAQWLNLSDYRPIVLPIGFLLTLFSVWVAPDMQAAKNFFAMTLPVYGSAVQIALPALLLLLALIQQKFKRKKGGNQR